MAVNVQTVTLAGARFVILPEAEYRRLAGKAGRLSEPSRPVPDAQGNYPAVDAMRCSLAQDIIRARRALGLTQAELARRAGIRPETLNRLEQGKHTASFATMNKLDRVLQTSEVGNSKRARSHGAVRVAKSH